MTNIDELKFDESGLIPAIVADAGTGAVLMLAYMNAESLRLSIEEGRTVFWSRSRGELWRKGETSGAVQRIVAIKADCDRDALLVLVSKDGPACHTGADSCFFEDVYGDAQAVNDAQPIKTNGTAPSAHESAFSIDALYSLVAGRKTEPKPGSYTTYLFEKGLDKILKKLGEESTEVIIAGKSGDKAEAVFELADLAYHALVLMAELGITPDDVRKELASRHVVDSKVKQERML
jgi:phosphoribosyl-ATP pyrophosphohydrolase/phosphoribosyl-AMP cyclohydrolase